MQVSVVEQAMLCIWLGAEKCTLQYIGETERTVKEKFLEHKGYVRTTGAELCPAQSSARLR